MYQYTSKTHVFDRSKSLRLLTICLSAMAFDEAFANGADLASVTSWCAAASRPAPALTCTSCHQANLTPTQPQWDAFTKLRASNGTDTASLDVFCPAPSTPTPTPPAAGNQAPVVTAPATATAVEGTPLTFTVTASDPNSDPVTLAAVDLPAGASFDPATGSFSWTADASSARSAVVTFSATDAPTNGAAPLTGEAKTTITVSSSASGANTPPVIVPITDQNATVGAALSFKVSASDKDGDTVTLSATGLPTGATFDPATAKFSWTPTADQVTTPTTPVVVTFTATDDASTPASASEAVNIFVNAAGSTDGSIKRVAIKKARWKARDGALIVHGRIKASRGTSMEGLTVNITDGTSGAVLGTAEVGRRGSFRAEIDLGADATVPCSIQVEVSGVTASKTVSRSGCGQSGGHGDGHGHGHDDDSHHSKGHGSDHERGHKERD